MAQPAKFATKFERPKQVSEVVLEHLRQDIITGRFALGEKISEGQLSELYGVTKAPIRSAYLKLQAEGLIEIKAQSGTYVFCPEPDDLKALCELRIALEIEATRLSVQRSYEPLVKALTDICAEMEAALEKGQQDRYQQLDTRMHLVFFELAKSPILMETYEAKVSNAFAALRFRFSKDKAHNTASIADHLLLLDFVIDKDLQSLRRLQRNHIEATEKYYEKLLETA